MISGYLPYVLIGTGGAMLTLLFFVTTACLFQHHSMIVQNGMKPSFKTRSGSLENGIEAEIILSYENYTIDII